MGDTMGVQMQTFALNCANVCPTIILFVKGDQTMKKILSMMLVMVLIVALFTGCSKEKPAESKETTEKTETTETTENNKEESVTKEEAKEPVEVNIFQFKVEIVDALENAIEQYEKENDNVTINLQTVGGGDDYGAALKAQFQSEGPTIFNIGGPQDVEDWMSKLVPLTDAPWSELVLDGVASGVTVDGEVYGLPFNLEGYGLAYNKAIFEAAGIDAAGITSFEALETALATITEKIDTGELEEEFPLLEAAVSYAAGETWVTGLHSVNMVFANEFTSAIDTYNAKTIEFKNSDGFKDYVDLMAAYSKHSDNKVAMISVDYSTQVDEGIALERVAVVQQGNWIYAGVKAVDETVAENLGFLPIPLKGTVEDSIAIGVPMYWAVNNEADQAAQDAAIDFLNWLYTSETGKKIVIDEMFFIPPLDGYDDIQPADPLAKEVLRYASAGKTMSWVFMGFPSDWGQGVIGEGIQKYYAGKISWEDMIEEAKTAWADSRK